MQDLYVKIMMDEKHNRVKASRMVMCDLVQHAVQLRTHRHHHIQYDKTLIFNERVMKTRSFDFTPSAETMNLKKVVEICGLLEETRQYLVHWQSR